jgi:phage-related protein
MATTLETLVVKLQADVADLKGGLAQAQTSLKGLDEGVKTANTGMGKFGASLKKLAGVMAATFGAQQLVSFAKDTVMAASNMEESLSKVRIVFGEGAAEVEKFGAAAAKNMGISNQAALEAAGTYGNLFQAFGLGQGESQKMSTSLVQLAADMASFNNTSVDDAILALRSGLSGETEPLKKFGVALSDVRLKAEAAAMGLGTYTGTLPPAIKSQAAYSLIMKDTTLAQGDYARTADGTANTMKTMKAQFDDAKVALGEALMPAFRGLLSVLKLIIPMLKALGAFFKNNKDEIKAFAIAVGIGSVAWGIYTVAVKRAEIAQKLLNLAQKMNPIGLIVIAVGLLAAGLVKLWKNSETFRNVVISVAKVAIKAFASVIPMVGQVFEAIMKIVTGPMRLFLGVLSKLPGVGKYAKGALDTINKGLDGISDFADKAAKKANDLITTLDNVGKAKDKAEGAGSKGKGKGKGEGAGEKNADGFVDPAAAKKAAALEEKNLKKLEGYKKKVTDIYSDMNEVIVESKEKQAEALAQRDERIADAHKSHGKTVTKLNERYQEAMSEASNRYNKQKIALNERYQEQLESAQKRYDETARDARKRHTDNLIKISQEYSEKKRELDYKLQETLSDLTEKAEEKRLDVTAKGQEKLLSIIEKGRERLRSAWEGGTAFNIKDLFGKDVKTQGASGLLEGLKQQLSATQTLQTRAGELAGKGYTQTFIEQIVKAGPAAGTEMADSLLKLDAATQTQIQELYMSLETLNKDGMNSLAESMNNSQSFATAELAEMYEATKQEIAKALSDIDTELVKNIAKTQKEYERSLAEAAKTRDEKLAESFEALNTALAAANEELLEAQKQAASELHKGLAEAKEAFLAAQEEAQKDLSKGLAEAQADLTEKLEEAQKDYQKAIDEIAKETEKKLAELRKKLAETAAAMAAMGAAAAAAAAMQGAPSIGGGSTGGGSTGGGDYYATKAAGYYGSTGYGGMTQAEIAAELRRESGNKGVTLNTTINATTNASAASIASSVVAAQKYGQAVTVSRTGGFNMDKFK